MTAAVVQPKGTGAIHSSAGARHARIWGVGGFRPERVVPNAELVEAIDSSDEWIQERSGIKSRRWAGPDDTVVSMSESAARDAISAAGIEVGQIDTVIVSTVSHPYPDARRAPISPTGSGLRCAAFDISAACAGYCHGISLAATWSAAAAPASSSSSGSRSSPTSPTTDRSTAFIFADGAGAAVVGPSGPPASARPSGARTAPSGRPSSSANPGSRCATRTWTGPISSCRASRSSAGPSGAWRPWPASAIEPPASPSTDLDAFIPHQANMRIIDAMVKQLKLPADIPVARDIVETANTSAASIPLATERMLREGEIPSGAGLQIGFGAGLVYAAQVVVLP
jgi:3-oxoacyl-[acyl-carrier-protein] synthase-3